MYSEYKKPMWNDSGSESPWLDYYNQYELKHCCFGDDGGGESGGGDEAEATSVEAAAEEAAFGAATGSDYSGKGSGMSMDATSEDAPGMTADEATDEDAVAAHQAQQEAIDEDPAGWAAAQADPSLATDWAGRAIGTTYGYLGTTETGRAQEAFEAARDAKAAEADLASRGYEVDISIDPETGTWSYAGKDAVSAGLAGIGRGVSGLAGYLGEGLSNLSTGTIAGLAGREMGLNTGLGQGFLDMAAKDEKSLAEAVARDAETDRAWDRSHAAFEAAISPNDPAQAAIAGLMDPRGSNAEVDYMSAAAWGMGPGRGETGRDNTGMAMDAMSTDQTSRDQQAQAEARGEGMGGRAPSMAGADIDYTGMPTQNLNISTSPESALDDFYSMSPTTQATLSAIDPANWNIADPYDVNVPAMTLNPKTGTYEYTIGKSNIIVPPETDTDTDTDTDDDSESKGWMAKYFEKDRKGYVNPYLVKTMQMAYGGGAGTPADPLYSDPKEVARMLGYRDKVEEPPVDTLPGPVLPDPRESGWKYLDPHDPDFRYDILNRRLT
jgi:hypothetical protein